MPLPVSGSHTVRDTVRLLVPFKIAIKGKIEIK